MVVAMMMAMVWLRERRPRDEHYHSEQQNLLHGPHDSNIRSNGSAAWVTLLGHTRPALNQSRYERSFIPLTAAPRLCPLRKKKTKVMIR